MSIFRLAVTGRWLGILVMTIAFSVACVSLGQWQFARRAEAQAAIALLNTNYDQSPAPLDAILDSTAMKDDSLKWTPVQLSGVYLTKDVLYVRTRMGDAGIGFEQLVPFRDDSGSVLVINRGWVASDDANAQPVDVPTIPTGHETVIARLMPTENTIEGRTAPAGQIATIHVPSIAEQVGEAVVENFYARLESETPAAATGAVWERPVLDEGPHLSYALQWYVFALMSFIGYGWALRKEAHGPVIAEKQPGTPRRLRDEDIEDAALDAASR